MNDYKEFNEQYGLTKKPLNHSNAEKTANLILDEVEEFLLEFFEGVEIQVALGAKRDVIEPYNPPKELTDIRYITGQQMAEYGMDVTALDAEVHRSNMSKAIPDTVTTYALKSILKGAKKRYPEAKINYIESMKSWVIKCSATGKVVKVDACYSPAVITDAMIGKK